MAHLDHVPDSSLFAVTPLDQSHTRWQDKDLQAHHNDIDTLATCTNVGRSPSTRKKAHSKDDSLFEYLRMGITNHQLGLSINCILLLALTHICFPALRPKTTPFFSFSYRNDETGLYYPGPDDFKIVASWVVIFTGLRATVMDNALLPLAHHFGIHKRKAALRFAEQAWAFTYYLVFWSIGMYLWGTSDYFFDLDATFDSFPILQITGLTKWYYLAQSAFWLQQIFVVHMEERRKDHWQMVTHHIVTCALIATSYGHYFTKPGIVVLCMMDIVDFIFPFAKMLKYIGYQTACDFAFGVFIVTWFLARHVYYLAFTYAGYNWHYNVRAAQPIRCYDPRHGTQVPSTHASDKDLLPNLFHAYGSRTHPVCFTSGIARLYIGLLILLQFLTIIWFRMICRVAYGVLTGKGAQDTRSDDEEEEVIDMTPPRAERRDSKMMTDKSDKSRDASPRRNEESEKLEHKQAHRHRRSTPRKGSGSDSVDSAYSSDRK